MLFLQLFSRIALFMLYLDFLLFTLLLFSQLLKLLLNEKCDILEKSCRHTIFMISDFNGGHRNGKKVVRLAVSAVSAWRIFGPFRHFLVTIGKSWNPSGYRVGQKWKSSLFPISMLVAGVTKSRRSNNLLMYLAQRFARLACDC
jgi:hypothetical protein